MSDKSTPEDKESQIKVRLREILDNATPPRMLNRIVDSLAKFMIETHTMKNGKTCTIINSDFSWIMDVDDKSVGFNGRDNANYFKGHYESLGYTVIFVDRSGYYTLQPPCPHCGSNSWLQTPALGARCAQCNKPVIPTSA